MNKDLQTWNKVAEEWDKQIAVGETYRTWLISNALGKALPADLKGLQVLDAGCGNGFFANELSSKGASVFGVDGSEEMIKIARAKYPGLKFEVHDLLQTLPIPDAQFDLIVANMLVMHLADAKNFFKESRRLLKPRGKLVFSILHPAFNYPTAKLYKSWFDKLTFAKPSLLVSDYYIDGTGRHESHLKEDLTHYHRTLEEYSAQLAGAGFAIQNLIEPHELPDEFLKQNPKLEYATRFPRFLFFNCITI